MINVSINNVIGELADKLKSVNTDDMLYQIVFVNILPVMRHRVHVEGLASDGSSIGTYSEGYIKVRTGNYPETVISKGKNKGQFRDKKSKGQAGVFTKGKSKGQPRPVYNYPNDSKVILSLTRQMQQDMNAFKTDNGWGIGYSNELNYNKAIWNETRYGVVIWNLSDKEKDIVRLVSEEYINNALNG